MLHMLKMRIIKGLVPDMGAHLEICVVTTRVIQKNSP